MQMKVIYLIFLEQFMCLKTGRLSQDVAAWNSKYARLPIHPIKKCVFFINCFDYVGVL
jgi:hypothetical protein